MFEERRVIIAGKSVSILIEAEEKTTHRVSRPPCFVLGLSSHYHDKFSKAFRSFYKLILLDLYWTDRQFTPEYIARLDLASLSDHIEAVRMQLEDQLGAAYQKIFVLAHSAYGVMGLEYGLRYPEKVLGIMNIASPLTFNAPLVLQMQEKYLDANFGQNKRGGPTPRWQAYYQQKADFAEEKPEKTKDYFVRSYLSKTTLFFNNPTWWDPRQGRAARMWEPWRLPIIQQETQALRLETRDIHLPMVFHYIDLIANKELYDQLSQLRVPLLWVISLGDLRVSLYQLDDKRLRAASKTVEFFHPSNASHWPMFSDDTDSAEFDTKLLFWGRQQLLEALPPTLSAPRARL